MPDPIQVFPEEAGPIPPYYVGGLRYAFCAYRDAEADCGLYGYGHTECDAIADFIRNEAEAACAGCTDCKNTCECILTSGELPHIVKREIETYFSSLYTPATEPARGHDSHTSWREANK